MRTTGSTSYSNFTNEDGNGTGKGLCLQLKAGNSHLTTRPTACNKPAQGKRGTSAALG